VRAQFATLAAIEDRPVREGDFVILDFRGERMTIGEPLEGAQAEDYMLEVDRGELLKDFEHNLIGMQAGERKQFGVTFPMDYAEASLRGQSVLFHVHLKEIKERDLPLLDEFAKEASEFETLDELRSAAREQLEAAEERRVEGEFRARDFLACVSSRAIRRSAGRRSQRGRRRGPGSHGRSQGRGDVGELRAEPWGAGDRARAVLPAS
jgi:trigger factor